MKLLNIQISNSIEGPGSEILRMCFESEAGHRCSAAVKMSEGDSAESVVNKLAGLIEQINKDILN